MWWLTGIYEGLWSIAQFFFDVTCPGCIRQITSCKNSKFNHYWLSHTGIEYHVLYAAVKMNLLWVSLKIFLAIFCLFITQSVHARIELFSLYVLFSHFSPFDATPGNGFFRLFWCPRAYACIIYNQEILYLPWEITHEICFFQMSSYPRACVYIIYNLLTKALYPENCTCFLSNVFRTTCIRVHNLRQDKGKVNSLGKITWPDLGK